MDDSDLVIKVDEYFESEDWDSLCSLIENHFQETNSTKTFHFHTKILADLSLQLVQLIQRGNTDLFRLFRQIYKIFRNSVAHSKTKQTHVAVTTDLVNDAYYFIEFVRNRDDVDSVECVKMVLQFLINLCVDNPFSCNQVAKMFTVMMRQLLVNSSYSYYASALMYTMFVHDIDIAITYKKLFKAVFDLYHQDTENEYLTFLIELFIKTGYLSQNYVKLETKNRLVYLKMSRELFDLNRQSHLKVVDVLCDQFIRKSDYILKTVDNYNLDENEAYEVPLLLDLLASISSEERFTAHMQTNFSFLICCVHLLKCMHEIGKESDNLFTPIQKLSELKITDDEVKSHPAFGIKASLVRVLGNLAWKNKSSQDMIRNLDCIPLLLDSCNIDGRNPLIIQHVVFALRNLCENNPENQEIISSTIQKGVVNSAAVQEMGLTLYDDGEKVIKIAAMNLK